MKKHGQMLDQQRSENLSGDRTIEKQNSNESNRSSLRPDETASPQNGRLRKKQPKQSNFLSSYIYRQEWN
jgi:hypothetical protein